MRNDVKLNLGYFLFSTTLSAEIPSRPSNMSLNATFRYGHPSTLALPIFSLKT